MGRASPCLVPGCLRRHRCRGFCNGHYQQMRNNKDPRVTPYIEYPVTPISDRFWTKVQKVDGDGCWIWKGTKTRHGYGLIKVGGRRDGEPRRIAPRVCVGAYARPDSGRHVHLPPLRQPALRAT